MKITTQKTQGVTVLRLGGRFDAHEVPGVRKALGDVTEQGDSKIVVNLAEVNFIDSSGLASLVQGMKHCRSAGGDLYLCELRQPVRVIFELTRLDRAFAVLGDEAEALAAFAAQPAGEIAI
ncbi:MAG: STAS domain-containing protein [Caldilineaceae bacterium]